MECSPFIMEFHRGSEMSETLLVIISILLLLMLLLIVFLLSHFYKNGRMEECVTYWKR